MPKELLVSDESINSHNVIVVTAGIDTARFAKNPIMLFNHIRVGDYSNKENGKNMILPIGTWKDLRKDGKQMYSTPVFDEKDEFAVTVKGKHERGVMRSASIGIVPTEVVRIEFDDKPNLYKVLKSELREISICDIPSNQNAVAFYDDSEKPLELSDVIELAAPGQGNNNPTILKTMENNFSFVPVSLGLSATATQEQVVTKIGEMQQFQIKNLELSAKVTALENQIKAFQQAEVISLVDAAVKDGKITAAQKPAYLKLAEADLENTKLILGGLKATTQINLSDIPTKEIPNVGGGGSSEKVTHKGMTFSELQRKDVEALTALKLSDQTAFNNLYKSEFGTDFKF